MFRKLCMIVFSVIFLMLGGVAQSDITATFANSDSLRNMIVEVADSGEMRFTDPDGNYFLFVDGHAYGVRAGPGGPTVITSEALAFQAREDVRNGRTIFSSSGVTEKPEPIRYLPEKSVSIASYEGTQYRSARSAEPAYVFTNHEQLLPLGRALASYFRMANEISAAPNVDTGNLFELLATHGVLEFWGQKLVSTSFAPIERARFVVPAPPITVEDLKSEGVADVPVKARRPAPIIRAVFQNHLLLTLSADGHMLTWAEGGSTGSQFKSPGKVRDVCRHGDVLFLVTQDSPAADTRFWSGAAGSWTLRLRLNKAPENRFLALDCSGTEPIVLTARTMRHLTTNITVPISPDPILERGYLTTLQHGGSLYVGANAGEWGGGLRKFPLKGGTATKLDGSDPNALCGGILNMACDPVTGLAVDPNNADCILVVSGLVHMMSRGSIVRVCGDKFVLAYAKPYTVDLGWHFDPKSQPPNESVPFFSMGSIQDKAWAVGSDGIYSFSKERSLTFNGFPRGFRRPASGIDWSNADFVLISTDMNQVHSLSGSSLILVPR